MAKDGATDRPGQRELERRVRASIRDVAETYGLSWEQLQRAASKLPPLPGTKGDSS